MALLLSYAGCEGLIDEREFDRAATAWIESIPIGGERGLVGGASGTIIGLSFLSKQLETRPLLRSISAHITVRARATGTFGYSSYDFTTSSAGIALSFAISEQLDELHRPDGELFYLVDLIRRGGLSSFLITDRSTVKINPWCESRFNFGFAHGVTGVIASLSECASFGDPHVIDALYALTYELLEIMSECPTTVQGFPAAAGPEGDFWFGRGDGWCYGRDGAHASLSQALQVLDWKPAALGTDLLTPRALTSDATAVPADIDDPRDVNGLCHGALGRALCTQSTQASLAPSFPEVSGTAGAEKVPSLHAALQWVQSSDLHTPDHGGTFLHSEAGELAACLAIAGLDARAFSLLGLRAPSKQKGVDA